MRQAVKSWHRKNHLETISSSNIPFPCFLVLGFHRQAQEEQIILAVRLETGVRQQVTDDRITFPAVSQRVIGSTSWDRDLQPRRETKSHRKVESKTYSSGDKVMPNL